MVNKKQRGNFDELLIEQVKKFPNLWDVQSPGYKDGESKVGCWTLIGLALDSDVAICKAKWKNLRDDYRKILIKSRKRSRGGQNTAKFDGTVKWKFYNQMQFLADSILLHDDTESGMAVNALLEQQDQPIQGLIDNNNSQNSNHANTSHNFNGLDEKVHHNPNNVHQNHHRDYRHRPQIMHVNDGHVVDGGQLLCAYTPPNPEAPSLNFAQDVPLSSALNSNSNSNGNIVTIGNSGGPFSEPEDEKSLLLMNNRSSSSAPSVAPPMSGDNNESMIVLNRKRPRNADKEEIDEDLAFGKYVGLALKSMKPSLKPCCKLQIQQIICGLQQDSLNSLH